ncbi:MAG: hypothetical protein ACFFDX_08725 [Candidatus Odinarchaeota archaeon]
MIALINKKKNKYPTFALILGFILLITLFLPFAMPVERGVVSKEALSFVWIWGLCYGQGEFFFLLIPMGLTFYLIFLAILILLIFILIRGFELKKNKLSLVKFGEQVFIFSFLIILGSVVLMVSIEYSFLFFSNIPIMGLTKADFWSYHIPGFGYIGVFFVSYLLLNVSLAPMGYGRSNFFYFALVLFIIVTLIIVLFSIDILFFPIIRLILG